MSRDLTLGEHLRQHLTAVGCTCNPDVEITTDTEGIHHAHIGHDNWCHLLARRQAEAN